MAESQPDQPGTLQPLRLQPLSLSFPSRFSLALLSSLPLLAVSPTPATFRPVAVATPTPLLRPVVRSADLRYPLTPERSALLSTIRYAEGTWEGGSPQGYRILYGGGTFSDLSRHPDVVVRRTYASAAAGAYQFLPTTWADAAQVLRLPDFTPTSQDQAALYLVEKRGALAMIDRQGLCRDALARLAPEWASLPDHRGASHYGQPVKDAGDLLRFYQAELVRQRRALSA